MKKRDWRLWIAYHGIREVSKKLGVTYEIVRAWANSGLRPSDKNKVKLVKLSRGKIRYEDFFKELEK